MSYPRFPAPFLDGLLDYLPLQTVLALASVDRREAPGREHVINIAACLNLEACGDLKEQETFLAKYRCGIRVVATSQGEYTLLCARDDFTRVTALDFTFEVSDLEIVPPALVRISAPCIYVCSGQLPTTLKTIRVEIWPRTEEQFARLTRLEKLETSAMTVDDTDHPVNWPSSLKSLTLIGEDPIEHLDHFPQHLTRLAIDDDWHYYSTYHDYSPLTTLKALIFPTACASINYCIMEPMLFPDGLVHLEIGTYTGNNYPKSLQYLKAGFCPETGMCDIRSLTSLRELVLAESFTGPLARMPEGLTRLTFAEDYIRDFEADDVHWEDGVILTNIVLSDTLAPIVALLPTTLISLNFQHAPSVPRRPVDWPPALTHVTVSKGFTDYDHLCAFVQALPLTLTHLEIAFSRLDGPLAAIRWPARLQRLTTKYIPDE
jgi:hypothetical protein